MASRLWKLETKTGNNEDFIRSFRSRYPDGSPVNLTGATHTCQLKAKDGTLVATATVSITNATNGNWEIVIPKATIAAIASGVYSFDVVRVLGGITRRVLTGHVTLITGVTQ